MARTANDTILDVRGLLNQTLPSVFRDRLPALLVQYRFVAIRLLMTTELENAHEEALRPENFYTPAAADRPARFTWNGCGPFHIVIRNFRMEFLRNLGVADMQRPILLRIWPADAAEQRPPSPSEMAPAASPAGVSQSRADEPPAASVAAQADRLESIHDAPAASASANQESRPIGEQTTDNDEDSFTEPIPHSARIIDAGAPRIPAPDTADGDASRLVATDNRPEETAELEPAPGAAADLTRAGEVPRGGRRWNGEDEDQAGPADGRRHPARLGDDPDVFKRHIRPAATIQAVRPTSDPLVPRGTSLPGNFYQDWFGFERMPFNNTPDPGFFFPTDKHQEALSRLIYAISERKGFVMVTGEIGSGKSTLCRTLLSQLPNNVKTALINQTHIDPDQLVRAIAEDLGLPVDGLGKYDTLQQINAYLIEQLAAGNIVCIIIDEAQNLSPAALEEVRMITNLETESEKLVQLILLGQPELRDKVNQPGMLQLRQRIAVQYHLQPLSHAETVEYIAHRLRLASPAERLEFERRTMHEVFNFTGGIPRLINTLCDNALLTAYTRGWRVVSPSIVREAAADLELQPLHGGWRAFCRMW